MDVIKTKLQTQSDGIKPQYSGMLDCARQIYRESGLRGFTRGMAITVGRSFPVNAAIFFMYEYVRALLG